MQGKFRPILLVLDFDGTLTTRDTMHLVAEAGYTHQKHANVMPQPRPWSEIVDAYMTDFKSHTSKYTPQASDRRRPEQESSWLKSLEGIETASIDRACAAGIFDNVTRTEMENAGRRSFREGNIWLRSGWNTLLARVQEHNEKPSQFRSSCRILSVNWSSTFIQGVVRQACEDQQVGELSSLAENVYANEIPSILDGDTELSTDQSVSMKGYGPVRTSDHKVKLLQKFCAREGSEHDMISIYVGDSTTDLDCLLEADVGFCVHDEPMGSGQRELAETCQRIGIDILPSSRFTGQSIPRSKTLWFVKDFNTIVECLQKSRVI